MSCTHALVGWKRPPPAQPYIRVVFASAPPCVPEPSCSTPALTAPCGLRMQKMQGLCCTCYDAVEVGVRLSDGEILCVVCASATFDAAEHTIYSCRPPVALFCRTDVSGHLRREELSGVHGRALDMLLSVRTGDPLQVCGCVESAHVAGCVASFVGFCVRRRQVVLRLPPGGESAVVCVRLELVRPPNDALRTAHGRMLADLLRLGASASTLQSAITAVRAAHTLCGTTALLRATDALDALTSPPTPPPPPALRGSPLGELVGPPRLRAIQENAGPLAAGPCAASNGLSSGCTGEAYPTALGLRSPALAARSFR